MGLLAIPLVVLQTTQKEAQCASSDAIEERLSRIEAMISRLDPSTKILAQIEAGRTANVSAEANRRRLRGTFD